MMDGSGLSVADALALERNDNNDGMWGGNGAWVFFLFFLLAWGGGFGGWGNNRNANLEGALTRSDLCQDMNFQQLENGVRGIQQGLCDGFYAQNTTMLNGFNGLQRDLCTGFANVNAGINQARFDAQNCCCETNRNIDSVKFQSERNTCDIVNAIREDGNATRALITQNQMQDLRDKLAERDRDLQSANFQLSQVAQTSSIVNQIKPCPVPAYLSCSPYTSYEPFGLGFGLGRFGFNGFNNGCGCNSGCGCC